MSWVVHILNQTVADELEMLPADMRARFSQIVGLIESHGLEKVREPLVKHLDRDLWEIRISGRDGIARAIYVTASSRRVVVVRVFVKKTQKTPPRELRLARQRAKEIGR